MAVKEQLLIEQELYDNDTIKLDELVTLKNGNITSVKFPKRKMKDGKWLVYLEMIFASADDLPVAEDFPDWHLGKGSIAITVSESDCYVWDGKGTWNKCA